MNFEKSFGTYDLTKMAKWYKHEDGGEFLIAPLNNNKQIEETMKLTKVNENVDNKTLYETKELSCKVLAKSVLIDWKGITDPKGKTMKFSVGAGEKVLLNYNEFTEWVITKARELAEGNKEEKEAETKN